MSLGLFQFRAEALKTLRCKLGVWCLKHMLGTKKSGYLCLCSFKLNHFTPCLVQMQEVVQGKVAEVEVSLCHEEKMDSFLEFNDFVSSRCSI